MQRSLTMEDSLPMAPWMMSCGSGDSQTSSRIGRIPTSSSSTSSPPRIPFVNRCSAMMDDCRTYPATHLPINSTLEEDGDDEEEEESCSVMLEPRDEASPTTVVSPIWSKAEKNGNHINNTNIAITQPRLQEGANIGSPQTTPPMRRPTIAMGESGAEVTFECSPLIEYSSRHGHSERGAPNEDNNSNSERHYQPSPQKPMASSPVKRRHHSFVRPMAALLDQEDTVSVTPGTTTASTMTTPVSSQKKSIMCGFPQACCPATPDASTPSSSSYTRNHPFSLYSALDSTKYDVQRQVSVWLSSPQHLQDWCQGWQAWSYRQLVDSPSEKSIPSPVTPRSLSAVFSSPPQQDDNLDKTHVQRVLRNRAFYLGAKRQRLASLRRDLHPFADDASTNSVKPFFRQGRIRSWQPQRDAPSNPTWSSPKARKHPTSSSTPQDIHALAKVWQCGSMECHYEPTPDRTWKEQLSFDSEVVDGYDSDPEDFTRRRLSYSKTSFSPVSPTLPPVITLPSAVGKSRSKKQSVGRPDDDFSSMEDHAALVMIQSFMNERLTLLLHTPQASAAQPLLAPEASRSVAIRAYVERGRQIGHDISIPSFAWTTIPNKKNILGKFRLRRKTIQRAEETSVSLLEVHRILEATAVDRSRYPMCKLRNAFWLHTTDAAYLLEASSPQERDRITSTLKLTIARFASQLVLNDPLLWEEFFVTDKSGPGKEPYWLR